MKRICLFSGGAASSYVAYLLTQEFDRKDIVLLHTPTFSEGHDTDRFRHEVARYLKLPITQWGLGLDIWELIDKNNCIPGQFIPFCTQQMKQKMKEEYYKTLDEDFVEYVGYGPDEYRRVQKAYARNESLGRKVEFPLFNQKITSEECKRVITEEWKIKLPNAYDNLGHANCIPCFKAGKETWRIYWEKYPSEFQKAIEYEEKIGHTVFKDISLKALAERWQSDKEWNENQVQLADIIPCECWV